MSNALDQRFQMFQSKLANSFDLSFRYIMIQERQAYLCFLSSLSDNELLKSIVEGLVYTASNHVESVFYPASVVTIFSEAEALVNVLSGQCVVIVEDDESFYCIETRRYPARTTSESNIEKSIRGAHDGFVENIIFNVGLIRRRLRNPNLTCRICKVGELTKSDVVYCYIQDRVKKAILNDLEHRINTCNVNEIMNEKDLYMSLYGESLNPYPHVRYSERPDLCAIHLMQGSIVLLMDNSPNAMILPTTYFDHLSQMEEYTQTLVLANITRIIRFVAIAFSLYLLPLWIACMVDHNTTLLHLPLIKQTRIEFTFQILFAECIIEWIRQSLIHTPTMLSQIMSFVAVFVLGEMAIKKQAYTEEVLIMVAICNLGNLLTPSYECSLANKVFRIIMEIFALLLGMRGFCIGVFVHVITLINTKTQGVPYLYPLIPFSFKEWKRIVMQQKMYDNFKDK